MTSSVRTGAALAGVLAASACGGHDPPDELLRFQAQERRAHLTYDAALMTSVFADTVTMIDAGRVTRQTRGAARERLGRYFASTTFVEWSDLEPPVVRVAASGDLATVSVRRRVRSVTTDTAGRTALDHTVFAWSETWRRDDGPWRLVEVVSTDRPGERDVAEAERSAIPEWTPSVAVRSPEEILERARIAVGGSAAGDGTPVESLAFDARCFGPDGPFETSVRSDRDGRIFLRQRVPGEPVVRRSVGPLEGARADTLGGARADSAGGVRALLQGHALLHLAADPAAVLGPPLRSGRLRFAGLEADLLEFRDGAGRPLELAYDRSTGHLLGARIRNPSEPERVILLYLSGRSEQAGLALPTRAVFLDGDDPYLYRIADVRRTPAEAFRGVTAGGRTRPDG